MNHSTTASHAADGRSANKVTETRARHVFVNVVAALTPNTRGSLSGLPSVSTTATVDVTVERRSAERAARKAAAHPAGPSGSPNATTEWNTSTAMATSRLERARLKKSFRGGCLQYRPTATRVPMIWAASNWWGEMKKRPRTSG